MSTRYSASDLANWCGGEILQGDGANVLHGLSIDSRAIEAGQLFAAIVGPNHDAHGYLEQAAKAGAGALLVEAARVRGTALPSDVLVVAVDDTTRGIQALATQHRRRFEGTLVALTGSSGKTTTKEMIAAVLEAAGPCLKTQGNLNNDYGVPLTLLRREDQHERAVIELGMNHRGEIARLAEIAQADVALVTNIGTAHIEHLGSQSEIAAEKGDLFASLDASGVALANFDDALVREQAKRSPGHVLSYGVAADADVRAVGIAFDPAGRFRMTLVHDGTNTPVEVEGLGETTIINTLAAASVGIACDLTSEQIAQGLSDYRGIAGRMSPHTLSNGATLIDDSYNANPQSMVAAIESLARLAGSATSHAVLGAMAELGNEDARAHLEVGRLVHESGISRLITVGEAAQGIAAGARRAGMDSTRIKSVEDHDAACKTLRESISRSDWILVKGSRAARMERIVDTLSKSGAN
ncbi:MAG: UDP-N-acetylmuramoyl-tripeptide--D-alanyl-D-alanine ligase [Myxococcota bacterium]|jgi:UDP-N-acetylmuramoyl-tripeptide--D-alanyl-D-alanine ligase|nr:UDP-N-acetylmuramoyl-tripeptide--D-alanyl-D-alanine ligase [Myxococcota bacterium]